MSLKDGLIRQTEDAINKVAERRKSLEDELEQIRAEETEARELLQLIKTGQVQRSRNYPLQRHTIDSVLAAIETLPSHFDNVQLARALNISATSSPKWGKRMVDEGILEVTYAPPIGVKKSTRYKKVV